MQHSTEQEIDSLLFHPEITATFSQQWMEVIRLAEPNSSGLIAIVFIRFISLGSVSQKACVTGITIPISASLNFVAQNVGIPIYWHVKEGELVVAGKSFFEYSNERQGKKAEFIVAAQQLAYCQQSLDAEQRLRTAQAQDKQQALVLRQNDLTSESALFAQEFSSQIGQVINDGQILATLLSIEDKQVNAESRTIEPNRGTQVAPNELPPNLASTLFSNAQQNRQGLNCNEALYRIKVKLIREAFRRFRMKSSTEFEVVCRD